MGRKWMTYLTCGLARGKQRARTDEYEKCYELFTNEERKEIHRVFSSITATEDPKGHQQITQSFSLQSLQAYIGPKVRDDDIINRLFNEMLKPSEVGKKGVTVTLEHFTITMAHIMKGTLEQQAQIILKLASDEKEGVSARDLYVFVSDILHYVQKEMQPIIEAKHWELPSSDEADRRLAKYLLRDLFWKDEQQPIGAEELARRGSLASLHIPNKQYGEYDIVGWLTNTPRFAQVVAEVFRYALDIHQDKAAEARGGADRGKDVGTTYKELTSMVPKCMDVTFSWSKLKTALDTPSILFINKLLPRRLQSEWRLLFSNRLHGESFNTMAQNIMNEGPSLLIVKDHDGHVFGGFAADSWEPNARFYGSARSFLFSLAPVMEIYESSGENDRYQYFNLKTTTLPSGLGFGGHFEYFGLWIDGSFGKGHCLPSTTYNNEQMSYDEQFKIDTLEVWGVGPVQSIPDEYADRPRVGSVLDSDPEGSAILELTGSYRHSDGFRENTRHSPGVKDLPIL
ncbi:MTOR-associated protein MEAK7-like isoform X2 [Ptychodera flava]|uniref:MTOR-associated protein MEAK7-like isoform X2 n=1 Tax=Ptychodera flava TaxID=63121 RepID=UPI003969D86C